jgi:predicted O-linked N-acetylglucosamine transferase (SPINDLY family)
VNTKNSQVDPNIIFQQAFQFYQNGRLQDAELMFKNLLQINPSHIGAKTMLGMIFVQSERDIEGIRLLKSSLIRDPKQFWAHNALGVGLLNTRQYKEAIFSFNKALILNPDYKEAYFNLGKTQRALRKYKDAIISYSKCIEVDKSYADAFSNRGVVYLEDLKEYENALANFQKYITLVPNVFFGHYNLGNAFKELKRYDDALVSYDRAIEIKPDYAEAYYNQGVIFGELKRYDDALVSYDRAIEIKPEMDYLFGNVIHTKMHLCDWRNLDTLVNQLTEKIIKHQVATTPFITLALIDDPELQKQSAEIYVNDKHPTSNALPKIHKYLKNQKIRIGYFSADFHNHATMHLIAELFEYHDKNKFELIAFSFGPDQQDEWRQKARSSFDQFINVRSNSDIEVASLARELTIDIAVDLKGFTQNQRASIFAHRVAPIQVNYLGYPGTMGAEYMDYIIADPILIPDDKREHYSEKIAYLPNSYQVNIKERLISDKAISRKEVGLSDNAFVFCSFNNNYKTTPKTFDCWLRILQAVEGSILWVFKSNETAVDNLKKEAEFRGIDSSRLVFASYLPVEEHLKRIQLADLFLDALPYNAHTTASDALRVGLPVITQMGESFASRVAASLLNAVGLPELITTTTKEYEFLAIDLSTNPERLMEIKRKLVNNLSASMLYNTKLFTQHIEFAYREMYKRYQDELAPDHIYVKN